MIEAYRVGCLQSEFSPPDGEPREVVVGDVTGDGLSDVVLLVHDRVLVYPQEPAP